MAGKRLEWKETMRSPREKGYGSDTSFCFNCYGNHRVKRTDHKDVDCEDDCVFCLKRVRKECLAIGECKINEYYVKFKGFLHAVDRGTKPGEHLPFAQHGTATLNVQCMETALTRLTNISSYINTHTRLLNIANAEPGRQYELRSRDSRKFFRGHLQIVVDEQDNITISLGEDWELVAKSVPKSNEGEEHTHVVHRDIGIRPQIDVDLMKLVQWNATSLIKYHVNGNSEMQFKADEKTGEVVANDMYYEPLFLFPKEAVLGFIGLGDIFVGRNEATTEFMVSLNSVLDCFVLDFPQRGSVKMCYCRRGISAVMAPPGNGNSNCLATLCWVTQHFAFKVMVCCPTNKAADVVAEKIVALFEKQGLKLKVPVIDNQFVHPADCLIRMNVVVPKHLLPYSNRGRMYNMKVCNFKYNTGIIASGLI
ncbi:AAA domain-containing protein [Ditylenchus destructor]|uniref:AAA domain-containing protein n=1 Tax=Ditylenchus destructor TaxID=166010 RepID=A0AAD4MET9_9BILA|nr:AAA domain-containing protein [Ditylenchus destructor]